MMIGPEPIMRMCFISFLLGMKNNDQNEGAKKKLHLEPFKDVLDDLIKSKRKFFYKDAFFLHFEQQKPIDIFFRLGLAEKGHVLLFGLVFLMKSVILEDAFFAQLEQHTP